MKWESGEYRARHTDKPHKLLSGLCAQLAGDFGWSVFWLRVVWVVGTLLVPVWGILLYVVGGLLLPKVGR
ncbi:PspC domain-containing protein [Shewanella sp. YIC-542]|uniref:PspC domain-containing protein n=1 Tax=Shewanella mytili TaxID=3377111 RepID=UPI00398E3A7C